MEIKATFKGTTKKLIKVDTITSFQLLKEALKKSFPAANISEAQLICNVGQKQPLETLNNEEDFQNMIQKYKKIKIFIDPTEEELKLSKYSSPNSTPNSTIKPERNLDESQILPPNQPKKEEIKQGVEQIEQGAVLQEKRIKQDLSKQEAKPEEEQKKYFTCKICKTVFPDGIRYRCFSCLDYDVCEDCFNKEAHMQHVDHKDKNHQFASILNREQWESIDFRPLIQLFLDPDYTGKMNNNYYEMPPIHHADMINKSKQYIQEMNSWKRQYERRVNNDIDDWYKSWKRKCDRKKKQLVQSG